MKKSLMSYLLTIIALAFLATAVAPTVSADWLIDRTGALVWIDGFVLGESDAPPPAPPPQPGANQPNQAPPQNNPQPKPEQKREQDQQKIERSRENLKDQIELRSKIQEKSGQQSNFELKQDDGRLKVKQEIRNPDGTLNRRQEVNLKPGEPLHLEQKNGEFARIMTSPEGKFEIEGDRFRTKSEFDLKVNEKNDLTVTLPNGNIRPIRLPDQALEKLIENGVITPPKEGEDQSSYELIAGANGEPIYQANGEVEKRILGLPFLKRKFKQKLEIAASDSEDGSVKAGDILESTSQEESGWLKFLERLSVNN